VAFGYPACAPLRSDEPISWVKDQLEQRRGAGSGREADREDLVSEIGDRDVVQLDHRLRLAAGRDAVLHARARTSYDRFRMLRLWHQTLALSLVIATGCVRAIEIPAATDSMVDGREGRGPLSDAGVELPFDGAIGPASDSAIDLRGAEAVMPGDGSGAGADGSPALDGWADRGTLGANIIFTTPPSFTGNLGGLAGADAICASHAAAAQLTGAFVAFVSTSTVDAADRLGGAQGWVRVDGRMVARTRDELLSGMLRYPPRLDAFGQPVALSGFGTRFAHTGTDPSGKASAFHCADWTTDAASGSTMIGQPDGGHVNWMGGTTTSCNTQQSLYCLQIDHTIAPATPSPATGRRVFISNQFSVPVHPDAACAQSALAAGLGGKFRALVATGGASAASRFSLGWWPWVRVDGVVVFASASDFQANVLQAPICVTAVGDRPSGDIVLTGAPSATALPGENCSSWSDAAGQALYGYFDLADGDWFNWASFTQGCQNGRVYCLEE
jgi:hypothetical protein